MHEQRSRHGTSGAKIGIGLVCISLFAAAAAGFGQQPPKDMESPSGVLPETVPGDYKNDPLFQEIQRLLLKGSSPSKDEPNEKAPNPRRLSVGAENEIDSISDARWHAIETLLTASRSLDKDRTACAQQGDLVGAAKVQKVIRTIRAQAYELLLAK